MAHASVLTPAKTAARDGHFARCARLFDWFSHPRRRRKRPQTPTEKLKRKIAKVTGIPTTSSGRKKKAERLICDFLIDKLDRFDK